LLLRQVHQIHSWYISLILATWGVLTWRFAAEIARYPTEFARWFCGALAIFWGLRTVLQVLHYNSSHWRGILLPTAIHCTLLFGYAAWTAVYAIAAFHR